MLRIVGNLANLDYFGDQGWFASGVLALKIPTVASC